MFQALLSLVLLVAASLATTGVAYFLIHHQLFLPKFVTSAQATRLSGRAVMFAVLALYLSFGALLAIAGALRLPMRAWESLTAPSQVVAPVPVPEPPPAPAPGGLRLVDLFRAMGPAAITVASVLMLMTFWSVGVAIERVYTFQQAKTQSKKYAPRVAEALKQGDLRAAIALSSSREYRYSHLARVVLAGLQEYEFQQQQGATLGQEELLDTVRRSIQRATALASHDLRRGVAGLATIGSTAPFIGLAGTVVGVVTAFRGIAPSGSGGVGAVSSGIAEALVQTALGLFVAIPAVWTYTYLSGRLEYFNVEMDNSSSETVDYLIRKTSST